VTRRANAQFLSILCACGAVLGIPALGQASSGGGGLSGSGPSQSSGTPQPGNVTVTASAGGMSIATHSSAFLANQLRFSGSAPSSDAGQAVEIERSGHETNWAWTPTVQAQIRSDGSFSAVWNTNHIGRFAIRAVLAGTHQARQNSGASASSGWPTVTVTVYRPSIATWYSDNGSTTACGEVLHKNTLGVANRTLPCGTQVALYYQGKTITVPVIDRGPYANHADWDLTQAAARLLSVYSVGVAHIGAVSLPRRS
jgi:rare lipoprotein A (peptidoglycan hydrolase)